MSSKTNTRNKHKWEQTRNLFCQRRVSSFYFFYLFLYMLWHISLLFASLETERAAERESRSPDQRCDRQHLLQEF